MNDPDKEDTTKDNQLIQEVDEQLSVVNNDNVIKETVVDEDDPDAEPGPSSEISSKYVVLFSLCSVTVIVSTNSLILSRFPNLRLIIIIVDADVVVANP